MSEDNEDEATIYLTDQQHENLLNKTALGQSVTGVLEHIIANRITQYIYNHKELFNA